MGFVKRIKGLSEIFPVEVSEGILHSMHAIELYTDSVYCGLLQWYNMMLGNIRYVSIYIELKTKKPLFYFILSVVIFLCMFFPMLVSIMTHDYSPVISNRELKSKCTESILFF